MSNSGPPEPEKKLAYALDPIHIGVGGYQLGRVDNSIVRDPATRIPKIPGTSIAGMIREYATLYLMEKDEKCKKLSDEEKRKCAEGEVTQYFGDEEKAGNLRFYDGQIVFFPVNSIYGTAWVTTKELLEYWCKDGAGENVKLPGKLNDEVHVLQGLNSIESINLGWLLLKVKKAGGDETNVKIPSKLSGKNVVVVSGKLFSHIVNDNLEVRTSVSIDPDTGAAKKGYLFTYEAIPRGTVIGFEIGRDVRKNSNENGITGLLDKTYLYLKILGLGGMGTRGFGRLEVLDGG